MRLLTILLLVVVSMSVVDARTLGRDPFEGKWKVRVEPDDQAGKSEKGFDDVLTFKGVRFESKALKEKGFPGVASDQDTRGLTTGKFTADQKHDKDKEQSARWEGSATGASIAGTLVWTKGGKKLSFNFNGSKD